MGGFGITSGGPFDFFWDIEELQKDVSASPARCEENHDGARLPSPPKLLAGITEQKASPDL